MALKSLDKMCMCMETKTIVNTLCTMPKTPEPRALIFFSSEGLRMRAWTLVPFSPGPRGSKLCQNTHNGSFFSLSVTNACSEVSSWGWMVSPLHSPGISSWLSCGGWPGLGGTARPGKTTPGRKSNQPGRLELCLWSDHWSRERCMGIQAEHQKQGFTFIFIIHWL